METQRTSNGDTLWRFQSPDHGSHFIKYAPDSLTGRSMPDLRIWSSRIAGDSFFQFKLYKRIVRGPGPGTSTKATWNLPLLPNKSYSILNSNVYKWWRERLCIWAQISHLARERSPYANVKFAGYDRRIRCGAVTLNHTTYRWEE